MTENALPLLTIVVGCPEPRAFASVTPQQTHEAGLLEGKNLTKNWRHSWGRVSGRIDCDKGSKKGTGSDLSPFLLQERRFTSGRARQQIADTYQASILWRRSAE